MKKILYLIIGATFLLASCQKIDNWDEPNSRLYGNVIDFYTGANLVMDQNDWQIRIIDRTWEQKNPGSKAQYQSLAVEKDGVYNNSKLFPGTYDMLPYDGPFWPIDTIKGVVVLENETQQDFTVTPYLQILDFAATLDGTNLNLTCKVKAPVITGLPNLYEIKAFLSLTTFCGASNYINIGEYTSKTKSINKSWASYVPGGSNTTPDITIGPLPVKSGYTYYVRIGANVNALSRKYNYSPIVKVVVP